MSTSSRTASAAAFSVRDPLPPAVGWVGLAAVWLVSPLLDTWAVGTLGGLACIAAIIVFCSAGVVRQAEALARRLGDPLGTLVLTLSVVCIEVALIAAVMLGPGDHATVARDSVMAVSMIILNLVIGLALVIGGVRHGPLLRHRAGVAGYLVMLVVLAFTTFALPALIGTDGVFPPVAAAIVAVATACLYALFLALQTGRRAGDFREVEPLALELTAPARPATPAGPAAEAQPGAGPGTAADRREPLLRLGLLVATLVPIVLLAHRMAPLLDTTLDRLGAPAALSGLLIAVIVFLPESITTLRAARNAEIQRVSNLCHGALVSTLGLTVPVVLAIGILSHQRVVLAAAPVDLLLLGVTLVLAASSLAQRRVGALHGAAHLVLFVLYAIALVA